MSARTVEQKPESSQKPTSQIKTRNKVNHLKRKLEHKCDSESDSDSELTNQESTYLEEEMLESEPELDCDDWDADCKTVPKYDTPNKITGLDHLMPTCERDPQLYPKKKQRFDAEIREDLITESFMNKLKVTWKNNETFRDSGMEIITDPFRVCVVDNFIGNGEILDSVRQEFYEIDWNENNMDLYEFFQSKDLMHVDSGFLYIIYEFLKTNVLDWVSKFMNVELTEIAATCSLYTNTDYLLCHDDQRGKRRVAFVLYLTGKDGWSTDKGGALQLLTGDEDGHPSHVVRDIFPANNQLVLFPVANNSYHQVAEITTREDCRLSINGWFYAPVAPTFSSPIYKFPTDGLFGSACFKMRKFDIDLHSWINKDYLNCHACSTINQQMEEDSEICLKNFFKDEPYREILQSLTTATDLSWKKIGPPTRFCYEVLDTKDLPHILERFLNLFQSSEMFSLLKRYTDLDLASQKATMKYELQRWKPGDYALLGDYDWEAKNELDLIMYFGVKDRSDVIGGRTQYVTLEDRIQTALITIEPEDNNLNIVYRDTARLTKYFSKQSKCRVFYTAIFSYSE